MSTGFQNNRKRKAKANKKSKKFKAARDALRLKNREKAIHDARVKQALTPPLDLNQFKEKKKNKSLVRKFKDLFKK